MNQIGAIAPFAATEPRKPGVLKNGRASEPIQAADIRASRVFSDDANDQ